MCPVASVALLIALCSLPRLSSRLCRHRRCPTDHLVPTLRTTHHSSPKLITKTTSKSVSKSKRGVPTFFSLGETKISPACTPRPAPNTSLIASSLFPRNHAHVALRSSLLPETWNIIPVPSWRYGIVPMYLVIACIVYRIPDGPTCVGLIGTIIVETASSSYEAELE